MRTLVEPGLGEAPARQLDHPRRHVDADEPPLRKDPREVGDVEARAAAHLQRSLEGQARDLLAKALPDPLDDRVGPVAHLVVVGVLVEVRPDFAVVVRHVRTASATWRATIARQSVTPNGYPTATESCTVPIFMDEVKASNGALSLEAPLSSWRRVGEPAQRLAHEAGRTRPVGPPGRERTR